MLDSLFGCGFSCKCKSLINLVTFRIDFIRRRRQAILRFLRKDVADLLYHGQPSEAFDRVEELIREQSISYGYEWVELFCGCIKKNLSCIQKQRECPPESREAVASLIYATARFGDLPALRDLRLLFTKRYGNALASFDRSINREFVEVMSSKPVPLDKKLCLMREISREFYVDWDFRSFELKISNSHASPTETSASETSPEPTNPMNTRQLDKAKNPSSPSKNSEVGGHDDGFDHREQPIRSDEERLVESSLGHKETSYMRKKYQKQSVAVDGNKDSNTKGSSGGSGRRGSSKKSARDMRRIFAAPIEEEEQWDEEDDAVMDELLMYYSCKCSAYESLEARLEKKNNNKSCAASSSMSPQRGRKGGIRIPSSPPEQMNGADVVAKEPPDAHVALPEPGKLRPRVWHVHPKLPDCDNFAAKLAALRKEYEGKQSSYQA